jgi:hypothetical protein
MALREKNRGEKRLMERKSKEARCEPRLLVDVPLERTSPNEAASAQGAGT